MQTCRSGRSFWRALAIFGLAGFGESRTAESTDVTRYCKDLVDIVAGTDKKKKPSTALQLMSGWMKASKRKSSDDAADLPQTEYERIFVHLLIKEYLKEKFHFTSYTTVSYIIRGRQAPSVERIGAPNILMDLLQKRASSTAGVDRFARNPKRWTKSTAAVAAAPTDSNKNAWLQAKRSSSSSSNNNIGTTDTKSTTKGECSRWNKKSVSPTIDLTTIDGNSSSSMYDFAEWSASAQRAEGSQSQSQHVAPMDDVSLTADIDWDDDVFGVDTTLSPLLARPVVNGNDNSAVGNDDDGASETKSEKRNHSMDDRSPVANRANKVKRTAIVSGKRDPKSVAKRLKL